MVYGALTKDYPWHNPGGAPWWKDWDTTRELRNDVAHKGKRVTLEEANRALSSADAYIKHVASAVPNALKWTARVWAAGARRLLACRRYGAVEPLWGRSRPILLKNSMCRSSQKFKRL